MSHATEHAYEVHHEHTSRWPIWIGLGIGAGMFSFLLFTQGFTSIGWAALLGGVASLLFGLGGWVRDMTREDIKEIKHNIKEEFKNIGYSGMLIFIPSEIFLFGSLFASYFVLRANDPNFYNIHGHEAFVVMGIIPAINTLLLVSSSFTLHFGEHFLKHGNLKMFQRLLGVTLILGYLFVAGQAYEYIQFITDEGFTIKTGNYGAIFYSLTGLHGLHVTGGALFLTYIFIGSFLGQLSKEKHSVLLSASIYWHFVDVVWIFLMMVIYLRWV